MDPSKMVVTAPQSSDSAPVVSGKAIASLVLGLLGCLIIPAIPALILGIIAYREIGDNPHRLRGQGFAVSGIILSILSLFMCIPIGAAFLFPVFAKGLYREHGMTCISNLKCISSAMLAYSQDYDECLPPGDRWNEALVPDFASRQYFVCPSVGGNEPTYALNKCIAGRDLQEIASPDKVAMLFDSIPGRDKCGAKELLPPGGRHSGGNYFAFADGHVKWISKELKSVKFSPPYRKASKK